MDETVKMRECTKCGIEKPETKEFFQWRASQNRLGAQCKACENEKDKERREKRKQNIVQLNQFVEDPTITKQCTKCLDIKSKTNEFFRYRPERHGYASLCRNCEREAKKEYNATHKEEQQAYDASPARKIKAREHSARYRKNNPDKIRAMTKRYYEINKGSLNKNKTKYDSKRRQEDPAFRLRSGVSSIISTALKRRKSAKYGQSCWDKLGWTADDLKQHLEALFEPWMNWDNYGKYDHNKRTWQVDHIIPRAEFRYTSMDDASFKECWALSNLRPLDAKQNISDGARKIKPQKKDQE